MRMRNMTSVSSDDICVFCGVAREDHGDKNHKFSTNPDAQLETLAPPPPPRNTPPQRASAGVGGPQLSNDPVARLQIRLIERMVAKGLLDGEDMLYIFGGVSEDTGR